MGFVGLVALLLLFWVLFSYGKGKYLGQEGVRAAAPRWFWLTGDSVTEQGKKSLSAQRGTGKQPLSISVPDTFGIAPPE